jgi:hypothetical protein
MSCTLPLPHLSPTPPQLPLPSLARSTCQSLKAEMKTMDVRYFLKMEVTPIILPALLHRLRVIIIQERAVPWLSP